ncbi:MAG: TonB-dependent receptor, partial [Deltaproteobacteria bacterium]
TLSLGVELSRLFAATAEDLTFGSTDLEPLFSERQGLMNLTLHRRIGRSSLRISGGFGGGVVEMRDVGLVQTEIFDEVAGFVEGYGGIRWRLPQGPGLALDLALDGTWGKITEVVTGFSPQLPLFYRRFSFVLAEEVDLFAIPATLRVGLSLRRDFANSFAFDPEYETLPESGTPEALEQGDIIRREDSIAPFIEVRSNPLPPLWLDLALRNDYVPQSGQGIPALLAVVNADLSPTLTAYFLAGNGWRLPTFLERYNHPFETGVEDFRRRKNTIPRGDPDLIPEEVVGVEGGLHFQHFGGMGQLGLSLSLFGRWNRNFVVAIPDADPENVSGALFTNGGARKRMGSEAALSWQGRRFSWIRSRIGVSWRFDPGPVPEGTPAIGPRFVATGLLVLHPPLFPNTLRPTMSLLGRYTDTVLDRGERFSLSSRPFAPRHLLFDANFALTAPSRGRDGREAAEWEIGLHVADLFDERVAQAPFGDALERRILLTLRMIW